MQGSLFLIHSRQMPPSKAFLKTAQGRRFPQLPQTAWFMSLLSLARKCCLKSALLHRLVSDILKQGELRFSFFFRVTFKPPQAAIMSPLHFLLSILTLLHPLSLSSYSSQARCHLSVVSESSPASLPPSLKAVSKTANNMPAVARAIPSRVVLSAAVLCRQC